jgi:hypothetical protein
MPSKRPCGLVSDGRLGTQPMTWCCTQTVTSPLSIKMETVSRSQGGRCWGGWRLRCSISIDAAAVEPARGLQQRGLPQARQPGEGRVHEPKGGHFWSLRSGARCPAHLVVMVVMLMLLRMRMRMIMMIMTMTKVPVPRRPRCGSCSERTARRAGTRWTRWSSSMGRSSPDPSRASPQVRSS